MEESSKGQIHYQNTLADKAAQTGSNSHYLWICIHFYRCIFGFGYSRRSAQTNLSLGHRHPRRRAGPHVQASKGHQLATSTNLVAKYQIFCGVVKLLFSQVTWGLVLQFVFGLLILRWPLGRSAIECIGQKIDRFLAFTNRGSSFVFGYLVTQQIFNVNKLGNNSVAFNVTSEVNAAKAVPSVVVFSALSVIYFFSFIVNILFHYGVIQSLTEKIGFLLRATIGTSTVESMNAASNIFLGQAMAPLLIQVY